MDNPKAPDPGCEAACLTARVTLHPASVLRVALCACNCKQYHGVSLFKTNQYDWASSLILRPLPARAALCRFIYPLNFVRKTYEV